MEIKKNPKANLEPHKVTYLLMGAVVALALVFVGFEWSTAPQKVNLEDFAQVVDAEEEIENTVREEVPPPPPPELPPPPETPEILDIVDEVLEENVEIVSTEDDLSTAQVDIPIPVAQVVEEDVDEIFEFVEQEPEFPGGERARAIFLSKNIKYPAMAEENNIQGRVFVHFIVERDGSITDVKVIRSVDPSLSKEAVRVISMMPKWIPGKQGGRAVRVKMSLPVNFTISTR